MESYAIVMVAVAVIVLSVSAIRLYMEVKELWVSVRKLRKDLKEAADMMWQMSHQSEPRRDNDELIKQIIKHLDLKIVEEFDTISYSSVYGETEQKIPTGRRIEPKTDNEKRIEELQREIDMLREFDKEMSE